MSERVRYLLVIRSRHNNMLNLPIVVPWEKQTPSRNGRRDERCYPRAAEKAKVAKAAGTLRRLREGVGRRRAGVSTFGRG
jgi:hypothetical protein